MPNLINYEIPIMNYKSLFVGVTLSFLTAGCLTDTSLFEPDIEATTFAPNIGVDLTQSTRMSNGLWMRDIRVGTGPLVAEGQLLQVRFTGWIPDGTKFDETTIGGPPFAFTLGAGQVIKGWDQGVTGMRIGGLRQLIIPPSLAFGSNSVGLIPPNSIVVFNIDLIAAQ